MKDNDLITRREVEITLLEKGQRSRRYRLGDVWELDFNEIREALSEHQSTIVRCKDCKHLIDHYGFMNDGYCNKMREDYNAKLKPKKDWFCADGERKG